MKKVASDDLKAGMVIGEAVHSLTGKQILFPKGGVLTNKVIDTIKNWDVPYVRIEEETDWAGSGAEEEQTLKLPLILQNKARQFGNALQDSVAKVDILLQQTKQSKIVGLKNFHEVATEMFAHLLYPPEAVHRLLFSLNKGSSLAYHSVMVGALSGMLAQWMNFDVKDTREIILAGLLHDIGKTQLPPEQADGRGTAGGEGETVQAHVLLAFKLLKNSRSISPGVLAGIVQHHEYMDGSGHPRQLSGETIHVYARVVGVVNRLSNMIGATATINPFLLLQTIQQQMFTRLDPEVCDVFSRRISDYLLCSSVILEDGRTAKVAFLPHVNPAFPVLQAEDEFIDMLANKEAKIVGLVV